MLDWNRQGTSDQTPHAEDGEGCCETRSQRGEGEEHHHMADHYDAGCGLAADSVDGRPDRYVAHDSGQPYANSSAASSEPNPPVAVSVTVEARR